MSAPVYITLHLTSAVTHRRSDEGREHVMDEPGRFVADEKKNIWTNKGNFNADLSSFSVSSADP